MRESLKVAADRLQQCNKQKREQRAADTVYHFDFCDVSGIGAADVELKIQLFYYWFPSREQEAMCVNGKAGDQSRDCVKGLWGALANKNSRLNEKGETRLYSSHDPILFDVWSLND